MAYVILVTREALHIYIYTTDPDSSLTPFTHRTESIQAKPPKKPVCTGGLMTEY